MSRLHFKIAFVLLVPSFLVINSTKAEKSERGRGEKMGDEEEEE